MPTETKDYQDFKVLSTFDRVNVGDQFLAKENDDYDFNKIWVKTSEHSARLKGVTKSEYFSSGHLVRKKERRR